MGEKAADKGDAAWATPVEFVSQQMPLGDLAVPRAPLVHVWYFNLGALWQTLSPVLGSERGIPGDTGEAMTMPQLRFARRFYLRMLLGAYLGVPGKDVSLIRGPRGKPVLDTIHHGMDLHFSLAKSGERILIGVSGDSEVGVDLELKDRKPRSARALARRFFTKREAESICGLVADERAAAFMRTWACKEAVAKASGHGIANRFCRFAVAAGPDGPPAVIFDEDHPVEGWQLALLVPEPDYLAAVAVRQASLQLEAFKT